MAPRIFITGATGYIGGDALSQLTRSTKQYDVAALVRNSEKGAQVASQYPAIRLVYGDLDSAEVLEEEARKADIVLRKFLMISKPHRIQVWTVLTDMYAFADCANADHVVAAEALIKGLAAHASDRPGYLIHTSGTGILLFADMDRQIFGEASAKVYDDWENVSEVTSIPDFAPHREVDKIILASGSSNVKSAIVCPPTIYGRGRGPSSQRSLQLPELSRCTLEKGHGIQVGAGEAYWTNVHVHDLSDVYIALVEAAAAGGGKASWGDKGYYFTENGEHIWAEISKHVASAAYKQGFILSNTVETHSDEEINEMRQGGTMLWGANSRCRAIRARKLLGWSPKGKSIEEEIPDTVAFEAELQGFVKHHAAKVAG
ncbi:MAG: hypothetical protein Q9171_002735 [Xanthocarpia ochracea]